LRLEAQRKFQGASLIGTLSGTPIDNEDTLAFMMQAKARFRVVLTTGQ
jgi:hypothetical protein